MPFTSPFMFGTSKELYPAQIKFEPDAGSGTNGGITIYESIITVISDTENYFGTPTTASGGYNYVPFDIFNTFTFEVLENTLSGNSVINEVSLIELSAKEPGTFVEQTIFDVWTEADGALFPTTSKTIEDLATYIDGLATRIGPVDGGSRSLGGHVIIGIKIT